MAKREVNLPPQEWTDRLIFLGGLNRYDLPNFKLGWAQYETFIAGGEWSVDEAHFSGYRELLASSGEPCWSLFQWHAPEEYGTPESYYVTNFDESTGLQQLGEYPYSGRYEILYNLRWHEVIDGRPQFHTMPLNTTTFDAIIPIILLAKEVSLEKRRAAILAAKALEEKESIAEIERHLRSSALPFTGSVSYTRQGIRSSIIDQKVIALQREWSTISRNAAKFKPGLQTS